MHHWLNNAGMVSPREPLFDVEPAEVVRVCNTNLTGAILCCQKAVRLDAAPGRGLAGRISSGAEFNGGGSPQRYHVYNFGFSQWGASFSKSTCTHKATKRGLSQLTASLAEELLEVGVDSVGVHQLLARHGAHHLYSRARRRGQKVLQRPRRGTGGGGGGPVPEDSRNGRDDEPRSSF